MKFSWGVHHGRDGSYVIENEDGYPTVAYGPMPASIVSEFLLERQQAVTKVFEREMERKRKWN
jgi:hypothetical protein